MAKNSKYSLKYRGNFFPAFSNTGVISVSYQRTLWFCIAQFVLTVMFSCSVRVFRVDTQPSEWWRQKGRCYNLFLVC